MEKEKPAGGGGGGDTLQENLTSPRDFFLHGWVFCLHVYLCTMHVQCLQSPEENVRSISWELQVVVSHHGSAGN